MQKRADGQSPLLIEADQATLALAAAGMAAACYVREDEMQATHGYVAARL